MGIFLSLQVETQGKEAGYLILPAREEGRYWRSFAQWVEAMVTENGDLKSCQKIRSEQLGIQVAGRSFLNAAKEAVIGEDASAKLPNFVVQGADLVGIIESHNGDRSSKERLESCKVWMAETIGLKSLLEGGILEELHIARDHTDGVKVFPAAQVQIQIEGGRR